MRFDGGDDDDDNKGKQPDDDKEDEPEIEAGDYNLGGDIGTKIGEGHDTVEDAVN